MIIIIQIFLFLFIIITYFNIAIAIPSIIVMSVGFISNYIPRIGSYTQKNVGIYIILSKIPIVLFIISYLLIHFHLNIWDNALIYVWVNPVFIGAIYLYSIIVLNFVDSRLHSMRGTKKVVMFTSIPIILLLIIGTYDAQIITPSMIKWGIFIGVLIAAIDQIYAIIIFPKEIQQYYNVNEKHELINLRINELLNLSSAFGDLAFEKNDSTTLDILMKRDEEIEMNFNQNKLSEAENLILLSEIDLSEIEGKLQVREKYWMIDEIKARLKHSKGEMKELQKLFQEKGIHTNHVENLDTRIDEILEQLPDENIKSIGPLYESLFQEIAELRTALRFLENIDEEVAELQSEIITQTSIGKIAELLNLNTSQLNEISKDFLLDMKRFQHFEITSAQEFVSLFRDMQKKSGQIHRITVNLQSQINYKWNIRKSVNNEVTLYIPKSCTTDAAAYGGIVTNWNKLSIDKIELDFDVSLIELQNKRIPFNRPRNSNELSTPFNFVGKKSGKGAIVIRSKEFDDLRGGWSFSVKIIPTVNDLVKDSSLWGAPIAALPFLLFWKLGYNLSYYIPISTAIGGAIILIIFLFKYISIFMKDRA